MATGALILTEASSGAPTLSGSNGTLCEVLDWALVKKGWAIEYSATNARVYRPGSGNRHRLFVAHDSSISGDARLATVRGCEGASSATIAGLVDPFPTVAQVSNANASFLVSTSASTAARSYFIVVTATNVLIAVKAGGSNVTNWDVFFFGDTYGAEAGDTYSSAIWVGDSSGVYSSSGRAMSFCAASGIVAAKIYWCRSIDGSVKSTTGCITTMNGSASASGLMSPAGGQPMRAVYGGRVVREKTAVSCTGSSSSSVGALSYYKRGWIPNLWMAIHSSIGSITSDDEFTDTAYASGSAFRVIPAMSSLACILELTDTWSPPVG